MLRVVVLIVVAMTFEFAGAYHMDGWHHDVSDKKKQQPSVHAGFKQLQSLSKSIPTYRDPHGVILPPEYNGRARATSDQIRSEAGRRGFARRDSLANQLQNDHYNHKGYARGGTEIAKTGSALVGSPLSQGSKGEMFSVKADSGSSALQGIQRSEEAVNDYEAELNRDHSRSRTTQVTDLGVEDPRSSGITLDWKNEGIDNIAIKSNQVSSTNSAKERTVDVINDREYGVGNAEAARVISVPV